MQSSTKTSLESSSASWVLPTTIQIHNLVDVRESSPYGSLSSSLHGSEAASEGTTSSSMKKAWLRPEHAKRLLKPIHMAVVVPTKNGKSKATTTRLATSTFSVGTVRPCWQHVDESIEQAISSTTPLPNSAYQGLRLLVWSSMVREQQDDDDDDNNNNNDDEEEEEDRQEEAFLNLPLHPSHWTRFPSHLVQTMQECNHLPLNTVIITYTDQSVRVLPSQYHYFHRYSLELRQQQQQQQQQPTLQAPTSNTVLSLSSNSSWADSPIFEEDAFRALDAVTPSKATTPIEPHKKDGPVEPATLLVANELVALVDEGDAPEGGELEAHNKQEQKKQKDEERKKQVEDDKVVKALLAHDPDSVREQLAILSRLLEQEEAALQEEELAMHRESAALAPLLKALPVKQEQTAQVLEAIQQEQGAAQRMEFLLEAQRIRLVKGLSHLYPVVVVDSKTMRCSIAGLDLQTPLFGPGSSIPTTALSDEHVSAALGHLCHVTLLLSKYLSVPLRHKLVHQASRSTIQDDRGTVYPLYLTSRSHLDREKVEYAVHLLDANVTCLCKARQLLKPTTTPNNSNNNKTPLDTSKMAVLVKTKLLYDSIIDGV